MTDTDPSPETLDVAVAALHPSLEAILMVADEPLDEVRLASVVGHPVADVGPPSPSWRRRTPSRDAASSCATWPAAGATTRARSTPPWSRASCWRASRPG